MSQVEMHIHQLNWWRPKGCCLLPLSGTQGLIPITVSLEEIQKDHNAETSLLKFFLFSKSCVPTR